MQTNNINEYSFNQTSIEYFPNKMLYEQYKNAGPSLTLILPSVLLNVAGVPGIVANFILIFVTILNKKLRGPTNYLLALTAFFEILHQSAHFVFLFVAASGINFINYSTALQFELHTIFGATAAQTALASTGVDRLLSVLIPLKYNKINIRLYLSIHTILVFSSGIWMSINAILFANKYPTLPVTGHIGDLFILDMEIMFKFIMVICSLNTINYILIWISVRCLHSENVSQSDTQSRLLKSLILIISIVIGGYIINSLCHLIINRFFNFNDIQNWLVNVFGGFLSNIGASAETPILYVFSSIYREAINKQLKQLFCKKFQKNKISAAPGFVNCSGVKTKQLINAGGGGGGGGIVNNNNIYPKK